MLARQPLSFGERRRETTKSPFVTVNYDKLNEMIKKRGTSRAKCAMACGINPGVLGASFKRNSRIRAEYLVKIADFLGVSPVLFLKDEDEKITNDNTTEVNP